MPVNKSALLRYRVIDSCLTNKRHAYPTMEYILEKIEEQLVTGISPSMFNKDIQAMKADFNAPIKFDRTRKGYYYTQPDFSLKEFPLTHDEIEALDYSTALLHQLSGTKIFQQFESAINKVIEGYRISKIIGKSETQILQVEEPVKAGGSEWLEIILKAIVEKNALQMKYHGFGKAEKLYSLSPYLLKEYRNRWYVVGFSDSRQTVQVFALDRINSIELSVDKYISDPSFSPGEFFKYSFGITQLPDAKPEKVQLQFAAAQAPYILTQPIHHSQKVLKNGNELVIELEVYITTELRMAVLSFGNGVKVIKPASLKNEIFELINGMAEVYK
jgi:predicted DNA-binding transcriptional regulator YafY